MILKFLKQKQFLPTCGTITGLSFSLNFQHPFKILASIQNFSIHSKHTSVISISGDAIVDADCFRIGEANVNSCSPSSVVAGVEVTNEKPWLATEAAEAAEDVLFGGIRDLPKLNEGRNLAVSSGRGILGRSGISTWIGMAGKQ